MEFKVGDVVVHPGHGMGHIVRLDTKRLSGEELRLYYEVSTDKSTVWVPANSDNTISLRLLTTKADLGRYRAVLESRPEALNKDHRQRRLELVDRLRGGSFQAVCEVVRDLTAHGWHKPLNDTDSAWLRKARGKLCEEWAAADGISVVEAAQELGALLLQAQQTYLGDAAK
ncbi:MAG: hypothetical protein HY260_21280 [Chloroflexi bacterium]|nr:hypothetical protein [Chloroflexota bacterium]